MTPRRPPVIAGLTGGVGTSTLAAALHARDGGRIDGSDVRADLLVCRSDEASVRHAAALIGRATSPRPVLAVTLDTGWPVRGAPRAGFSALPSEFGSAEHPVDVAIPYVARWHGLVAPLDEAAAVLAQPAEHLPRPVRAYAGALQLLVAAVVGSGALDHPTPPAVTLGTTGPCGVELWRGLRPVQRSIPPRPVPPGEPDDDALEADQLPAPVAVGRAG